MVFLLEMHSALQFSSSMIKPLWFKKPVNESMYFTLFRYSFMSSSSSERIFNSSRLTRMDRLLHISSSKRPIIIWSSANPGASETMNPKYCLLAKTGYMINGAALRSCFSSLTSNSSLLNILPSKFGSDAAKTTKSSPGESSPIFVVGLSRKSFRRHR